MRNQYTKPFNEISGVVTEFQNAVACARRIFDLIAEEPQIPEPENAVDMKDIKGNVKAEDVSFSYTPEQKLIEHFNLSVRTGTADRHRRAYRMRKDDIDQSSHEVLRCRQRRHPCGRRGHKRDDRRSLRAGYGMVLQDTWLKTGTIEKILPWDARTLQTKR